jgi:hypothetical protein
MLFLKTEIFKDLKRRNDNSYKSSIAFSVLLAVFGFRLF